jgi:transcriptional regulator
MGKRYISIEKIKALAEKGLARTEIANRVGCCRQYISQVVDAYNIDQKRSKADQTAKNQ